MLEYRGGAVTTLHNFPYTDGKELGEASLRNCGVALNTEKWRLITLQLSINGWLRLRGHFRIHGVAKRLISAIFYKRVLKMRGHH